MAKLSEYTSFADAQAHYSTAKLWEMFDGTPENFNTAHECIDRWAADPARVAVNIVRTGSPTEAVTFRDISEQSSRLAHWLVARGIKKGDRVAFMLEPSRAFYISLFGALKCGAISVPMFTLFGPDGVKLRLNDCTPSLLIVNEEKLAVAREAMAAENIVLDTDLMADIASYPTTFETTTTAADLAVFQYTSGTTRDLPAAVKHQHRAVVVLTTAALYGTGIRPGDRFFCPSSPAWGHGLWHGTLAPLALGVTTGAFAGKFDAKTFVEALDTLKITNLSAASTHYRMIRNSGVAEQHHFVMEKLSYTGEPIDPDTLNYTQNLFKKPVCSMYGTTEIGVILVNYPGAPDYQVKDGSLGKPVPGMKIEVRAPDGTVCPPEQKGEIMLFRKGEWLATKDLGWTDADGYFYHGGRADDVIISAGWTISPVEIEQTLLRHETVAEVAVIGVPDGLRGLAVKAFIVTKGGAKDEAHIKELQDFTRHQLSAHEYPRIVEFVDQLIKTPAGKINRKALRDLEAKKIAERTV
ncbi:acyl-CoA synthetase [Acidocella sp.]|uniref:acyl-CoA synthetase n=1 Tax=Acidocella sp. TaxID=50710 RepID=UPI00261A0B26|nr:acyl-CoA synthetase [Acidocella sp.]